MAGATLLHRLGGGRGKMVGRLYVSESAPAHMRGALMSTVQLTITIGILGSYEQAMAAEYRRHCRQHLGTCERMAKA